MRTWTRREVMAASALGAATLAARRGQAETRQDDKEKPKGSRPRPASRSCSASSAWAAWGPAS